MKDYDHVYKQLDVPRTSHATFIYDMKNIKRMRKEPFHFLKRYVEIISIGTYSARRLATFPQFQLATPLVNDYTVGAAVTNWGPASLFTGGDPVTYFGALARPEKAFFKAFKRSFKGLGKALKENLRAFKRPLKAFQRLLKVARNGSQVGGNGSSGCRCTKTCCCWPHRCLQVLFEILKSSQGDQALWQGLSRRFHAVSSVLDGHFPAWHVEF